MVSVGLILDCIILRGVFNTLSPHVGSIKGDGQNIKRALIKGFIKYSVSKWKHGQILNANVGTHLNLLYEYVNSTIFLSARATSWLRETESLVSC